MAGALDRGGNEALVFQRVARDAAREQFALFVDELEQKDLIFIVDVLDPEFAEAAIFLALHAHFRV